LLIAAVLPRLNCSLLGAVIILYLNQRYRYNL